MSKQLLILSNFQTLKEYPKLVYNSIIIIFLPTFDFRFQASHFQSLSEKQDYCLWCHLLQLQFDHHQVIIYRENFWAWPLKPGFFANSHSTWTIKRKFLCITTQVGTRLYNKTKQKVAYRVSKQVLD